MVQPRGDSAFCVRCARRRRPDRFRRAAAAGGREDACRRRRCLRPVPFLSLGARISGSLLRCRRRPAAEERIRCRRRQSAVGHDSSRCRIGRRARSGACRRRRGGSLLAPIRDLPGPVGRPRQPLPAVCRARDRSHPCRRANRPGAAVRAGHRPRQRGAEKIAAGTLGCRRHRRRREPARRVSDSPQRPVPARHRIERVAHA